MEKQTRADYTLLHLEMKRSSLAFIDLESDSQAFFLPKSYFYSLNKTASSGSVKDVAR